MKAWPDYSLSISAQARQRSSSPSIVTVSGGGARAWGST